MRNLKVHRYLPRLASFLSSRDLTVFELSQLSNVSPEECEDFLRDMDVQGILERMDSTPVPALSTEPESRPSQTPEQDATVVDVAPAQLPAAVGSGQTSDEFHTTLCVKDSGGPYHHGLSQRLRQLADEAGIPYKVDIYPSYGSDGEALWRAGGDAAVTGEGGTGGRVGHIFIRANI